MFTGLITAVGRVVAATGDHPRRLTITSPLPLAEVALGDSIAIDGCCLTVVEAQDDGTGGGHLVFEAATETLKRTTLGQLRQGDDVNLEPALRLGDRLGGHLVLGHVDGVGTVVTVEQRASARYYGIRAPAAIAGLIAAQGSVTVAGVSLTVTGVVDGAGTEAIPTTEGGEPRQDAAGPIFYVGLIPHTLQHTTFAGFKVGSQVNLEADMVARYVARLTQVGGAAAGQNPAADDGSSAAGLSLEDLHNKGF